MTRPRQQTEPLALVIVRLPHSGPVDRQPTRLARGTTAPEGTFGTSEPSVTEGVPLYIDD